MNVLFPAPFGPSSPMVPWGTCTVTSTNARCEPYVLPRRSDSMMNGTSAPCGLARGNGSAACGFNEVDLGRTSECNTRREPRGYKKRVDIARNLRAQNYPEVPR